MAKYEKNKVYYRGRTAFLQGHVLQWEIEKYIYNLYIG